MNLTVFLALATVVLPILWSVANIFVHERHAPAMSRINAVFLVVLFLCGYIVFRHISQVDVSFIYMDEISRIFYLLILATVMVVNIYAVPYFQREIENKTISTLKLREYLIYMNLFVASMLLVTITRNLIIMWIGIEATTISTVFLISFYDKHRNWESAWKYLVICGTGITLGLFGILTLIYAFHERTPDLINFTYFAHFPQGSLFNADLIKIGFLVSFVGFATKVGIFPMNTWVPDAHSKASSPVSACMSSVLLPLSLYILLRIRDITDTVLHDTAFTSHIFVVFGIVTLVYCGIVLLQQFHYKRALAYSSSENMAIALIAFGLVSYDSIFAFIGILHIIAHAFIKQGAFMTTGNIMINFESGNYNNISDLPRYMKYTTVFLIFFVAMLAGVPPSPLFFTELLLIFHTFLVSPALAVIIIAGLIFAFAGLLINFSKMFTEKETIKIPFDHVRTETSMGLLHAAIIASGVGTIGTIAMIPYLYALLVK